MSNIDFKITIPLEKAESSDDRWIIRGVAAGIDVDKEGHVIPPEGIQKLAEQIASSRIPFRNQHNKESIMEDLGWVVKAEIDPDWKLWVDVELDKDNPGAQYIWNKLGQNKQFGMSVLGKSIGYYQGLHKESGQRVVFHPFPLLEEISATTRPIYTPSLGTVIKKAMDEAHVSLAAGDTTVMSLQDGNGENANSGASAPDNATSASTSPSNEEVAAIIVKSMKDDGGFRNLVKSLVEEYSKTEEEEESEDTTQISKSESSTDIAEIVKSAIADVTDAYRADLKALAERIPEVPAPGVLQKSEQETDKEVLAELRQDPRQALRVGLAYARGEQDKLV